MKESLSKDSMLTTLGLAFFWPAIHNQALYPLTLTFNKEDAWPAFYFYLVYALIAIATSVVLYASRKRKARILDNRSTMMAFGALGVIGFIAMARFGFESVATTAAIGVGAALYAVFTVVYFNFWSIRVIGNARDVISMTAGSYVIACLLGTLRLAFGMHTVLFGLACATATAACAGFVSLRPLQNVGSDTLRDLRAYPLRLFGLGFLLLGLLLGGIALSNPAGASSEYPPSSRAFMYLGCAALSTVVIAIRRKGARAPYRAALLTLAFLAMVSIVCMLITGFAVLPPADFGNFPLIGCKIVIEMYLWAIVLHCARRKRLPISSMMCVYLIVIVFLPNIVTAATLHLGVFSSAEDAVLLATLTVSALVVCVVVNLMLAAVLFGGKRKQDGSAAPNPASQGSAASAQLTAATDPLAGAFDAFQSEYGLSNRQMDVVRLAYRNWTSKRIGEELFISEGTVKTHLKTIYKRADLHSKQELIDAVDAWTQLGGGA